MPLYKHCNSVNYIIGNLYNVKFHIIKLLIAVIELRNTNFNEGNLEEPREFKIFTCLIILLCMVSWTAAKML